MHDAAHETARILFVTLVGVIGLLFVLWAIKS